MKLDNREACHGCAFIAGDDSEEPCRSCKFGILNGKKDNYSKEADPNIDTLAFKKPSTPKRK